MAASVSRISVMLRVMLIHFAKVISGFFHPRFLCQVLCPLSLISVKFKISLQSTISRSEMFYKIGNVKNLVKFKGKHMYLSLLLIRVQAAGLQVY